MPITTQCSATDEGAKDVSKLWQNSFSDDVKPEHRTLFTRTWAVGCVLDTYERNGYDDSDFFATYWDEKDQCVKTIEYATTRGWTYANGATIDATPEVIEKALQYEIKRAIPLFLKNSLEAAKTPAKNRLCKVIKGRKIAKGELVTVIGNPTTQSFGFRNLTTSVLVRLSNGSLVHTNITNLEVVNPEQYVCTEEQAKEAATAAVRNANWRSMAYVGVSPQLLSARAGSRI